MMAMTKSGQTFIDQVRRAARDSGMSRSALAEASGVDLAAVSRFVSGKRGLSVESLNALAKVLELRVVAGRKAGKK